MPQKQFNGTTFKTGTSAFVEKNGTEYTVKFASNTGLDKYPYSAQIVGGDEEYVLVSGTGKLNTGEQLYMAGEPATIIPGGTGYINLYVGPGGKPVLGAKARIHPSEQIAKDKAKNAESEIFKAGVKIVW